MCGEKTHLKLLFVVFLGSGIQKAGEKEIVFTFFIFTEHTTVLFIYYVGVSLINMYYFKKNFFCKFSQEESSPPPALLTMSRPGKLSSVQMDPNIMPGEEEPAGCWQTSKREWRGLPHCSTSSLPRSLRSWKTHLSCTHGPILPHPSRGHFHTRPAHAYLLVLIGRHSYELGFREGAVHHHSMGTSNAHYVNLGFIFMQRIQHYL